MARKERVAIITGAAGGIGRHLVKAYLKAKYKVYALDINGDGLQSLSADLSKEGMIFTSTVDLAFIDSLEPSVEAIVSAEEEVHVLINNAGKSHWKDPEELTVDQWNEVMNVNLRAPFLLARLFVPALRKGGGSIINIASTRAIMSEKNSEAYAASKGGLLSLTHALAASLGPDIRVNAISPGWIHTGGGDELRDVDHEQHLSGRVGHPQDVARAALFLSDEENDFVTGTNIVIDGGITRKMIYEG